MVETTAISRRFGARLAVDQVSLVVQAGEVLALLGPNGAGKTTLIKMLTTLLPPSSGGARVAGFDIIRDAVAVRRAVGYVPQAVSADGGLSGEENLSLFARLYDVPRSERRRRIREALEFMGLADAASSLVRTYSGGMIRRLEIAQAILHRPSVLILDEPTVGLDPVARQAVWTYIGQLRAGYGLTVLFTTHYMEEAEALCDRVAIMHHGRVVATGTPAALADAAGVPGASLETVFARYTGDSLDSTGEYRETLRARRTIRRLG